MFLDFKLLARPIVKPRGCTKHQNSQKMVYSTFLK